MATSLVDRVHVWIPGLPGRAYVDGESVDLSFPIAWTIDGVMTEGECTELIERVEAGGPAPAPITTSRGFVMRPDIRNNLRVTFDDVDLASTLFERVRATLPREAFGNRVPVGANERFRAYKYLPGQRFAPHFDGAFRRNDQEESHLTFMVYLNEGFSGGATTFLDHDVVVRPRTGMALLFQHRVLHEGSEVTQGVKYVARSDVMFRTPT